MANQKPQTESCQVNPNTRWIADFPDRYRENARVRKPEIIEENRSILKNDTGPDGRIVQQDN